MFSILILLGLVIGVALWGMSITTAWSRPGMPSCQINVQLQRRFDLIPNLIETAKGYFKQERETLEAVTAARGAAVNGLAAAQANPGDPTAMAQLAAAQGQLKGALGRLLAVAEAYSDLKANQNMMQLTEELTSTENKVAFARQAHNDAVMAHNNRRGAVQAMERDAAARAR